MYESYWQLTAKPFDNVTADEFYYPGESHQGALLKLRYAVESRRGGAVLAGPAGTGKSLLVNLLAEQLPETCAPFVHLVFPQMTPAELLAYLADRLAAGPTGAAASPANDSVRRIEGALADAVAEGRHPIIAIDEAQLLAETDTLETVRLLLNFEIDAQPAWTVLLVGQTSLLPIIDRMPTLEQRLGVKCLLRPFSLEETISYVNHRLNAAGAKQTIFENGAVEALHELSGGVPRRINRLADLALLVAYAEEKTQITISQVEGVCEELIAVAPD